MESGIINVSFKGSAFRVCPSGVQRLAFGLRPFSLSAEARRAKEDVWGLPFGCLAFGLRPFRAPDLLKI